MQAGVRLCWSLSVSFHKLIPPLISDLAHSYWLFFSPAGLAHIAWCLFGSGEGRSERVKRRRHGAMTGEKTKVEPEHTLSQHDIFTKAL